MSYAPQETECGDKVAFLNKQQAKERIDRMPVRPITLGAYKCSYCGFYHLGNNKRRHNLTNK